MKINYVISIVCTYKLWEKSSDTPRRILSPKNEAKLDFSLFWVIFFEIMGDQTIYRNKHSLDNPKNL